MQLTVRDVAGLLNISEKTVYRMIQRGDIPTYKVHEQYRFNRTELLEWATTNRINFSAEIFKEPDTSATPLPNLADALEAGGIHYRVEGQDKDSALRSVVKIMRLPEDIDREFLTKVLLAREDLASTGIGDGIAVPHPRNPIVLQVSEPFITLCFLENAIEFGSLDGLPVHSLFTFVTPNTRAHLHLLARLSFSLRDPKFREAIQLQASRETILREARRIESDIGKSHVVEMASHI